MRGSVFPVCLVLSFLVFPTASAGEWQQRDVTLAEVKDHFAEICVRLVTGNAFDIELASPQPIDFNVHFHTDTETLFPVRARVHGEQTFSMRADRDGEYCLMWTNPQDLPEAFVVRTRYRVR